MEEKELWMNKLKEKLADYSEPAPASGWEQLEKELMPPVEKKIYPYRKWMMAAAAIIILAVVSSVSLYFLGTPAADEIRDVYKRQICKVIAIVHCCHFIDCIFKGHLLHFCQVLQLGSKCRY